MKQDFLTDHLIAMNGLSQLLAAAAPVPGTPKQSMAEVIKLLTQGRLSEIDTQPWVRLGEYYGLAVALVIVLMILAWTISGWLSAMVDRGLTRVKFDETLTKFLARLVRWTILLLTVLTCLSYFGVETTSFAAVIGALGLAIGLAFQGTLSNFAAGAMLLIFRPYKVGDLVNVAGYLGTVNEIALFTTELDTLDGRRVIIPNSSINGSVIENITHHPVRRVDVAVGTAYAADIDATRQALQRALVTVPQALADPKSEVVLTGLGASSVDWSVRVWVKKADFSEAKQALLRAVKLELGRSEIEIPFPQMDVHLRSAANTTQIA